eukprot:2062729-Rhodomonas_salina.2
MSGTDLDPLSCPTHSLCAVRYESLFFATEHREWVLGVRDGTDGGYAATRHAMSSTDLAATCGCEMGCAAVLLEYAGARNAVCGTDMGCAGTRNA